MTFRRLDAGAGRGADAQMRVLPVWGGCRKGNGAEKKRGPLLQQKRSGKKAGAAIATKAGREKSGGRYCNKSWAGKKRGPLLQQKLGGKKTGAAIATKAGGVKSEGR